MYLNFRNDPEIAARAFKYLIRYRIPQLKADWAVDKDDNHMYLINSEDIQVGLNKGNGIFFVCFPQIFMVDFDEKDGIKKEDAVEIVNMYCEKLEKDLNEKLTFRIYETDRGIHAFLTSHFVNPDDLGTLRAMLELRSDINYVAYSSFRGFCVRVSPKMTYRLDMVAKRCYDGTCVIGNGEEMPYIKRALEFKEDLVNYFKELYITYTTKDILLKDLAKKNVVRNLQVDVAEIARKNKISLKGDYPITFKVSNLGKGFENILDKDLMKKCEGMTLSMLAAKRYFLIKTFDVKKQIYLLGHEKYLIPNIFDFLVKKEDMQMIKKNDMPRKYLKDVAQGYILAFDTDKKMFYMIFRNILTLDWDKKDGFDDILKIEEMLEMLVKNAKGSEYFENDLTFRIYETDNGFHAYCTSELFDMNSIQAKMILKGACNDIWYSVFSGLRGFSHRISPKLPQFKIKGVYPDMKKQFVVRPANIKVGDGKEIKLILAMLDHFIRVKDFVLTIDDYEEVVNDGVDKIHDIYVVINDKERLLKDDETVNEKMVLFKGKNAIEKDVKLITKLKPEPVVDEYMIELFNLIKAFAIKDYNKIKKNNLPGIKQWENPNFDVTF